MAVSTEETFSGPYLADGLVASFPFQFRAIDASDVAVLFRDSLGFDSRVNPDAYTVSLGDNGGTVVFYYPPLSGLSVVIFSEPSFLQQTQFENGSRWLAEPVNNTNDRAALRDLALRRGVRQSIRSPLGEEFGELPPAAIRAGGVLKFNDDTGEVEVKPEAEFAAGPPGPANNTRRSLAELKAAATSDLTSIYNGYLWVWTPGDFSDVPASQIDRTVVQSDSAPLSVGAWRRQDGALYAGNFGIIGDGVTDETATVQAFLDLCEALGGRDAYFGGMMVRTTGPLTAHNVAIYFDPVQLTAGFRPLGSGYTVLTVTGTVTGGSISVIGYGEPELDVNGNPIPATPDNRPALNGIAFGAQDGSEPLSLSTINSVRVYGFAGSGIINTTVWDCTFLNTSVQYCGTATSPAFASTSPGGKTVNESNWIRLQVEESVGQAIYIAPDTLNCTYGLIHGERNWGVPGVDTWFLSGTGSVFESVRLQAHVPANATARLHSDNMTITNLRPEGELTVYVKPLLNGSISIISPTANAQLTADPTSQGKVTVIGGVYSAIDVRGGWSMIGGDIFYLQPGNMGADELADVVGARVRNLTTSPLSTNGNIQLTATNVDALTTIGLARIWLVGRSRAVLAAGANVLANLFVHIDATSTLVGNVTLDTCGLKLGGVIEGDLTIGANRQVLASDTAYVTGTVTNDGPPEDVADNYLGEFARGMRHKSLAPAAGQPTGWIYDGSAWLAEAPLPVPTP